MSRPWLRLYTDVLHNAKAHRLNDAEYRTWIGLLAAFRANDDVMPSNADLAKAGCRRFPLLRLLC